jgi:hypothetical protein
MKQTDVVKKAQTIAIEHFLSDFDRSMSYEKVLEAIENEDDSITVWEPFEYHDPSDVVDLITSLEYSIKDAFKLKSTKRKKK